MVLFKKGEKKMQNVQLSLWDTNSEKIFDTVPVNILPVGKVMKVISLFSGCGGMDLGFRGDFTFLGNHYDRNPYEIVFANDIIKI